MAEGAAMNLDPDRYICPEHQADLTALVKEALEGERPVTFQPNKPRPFRVIVDCPGSGGTGSHELACQGIRAP